MAIIPDECKFHVVSENVNTVDKGSKLAQSKRESITMADIKQSIPHTEKIFERASGAFSIKPVTNPAYSTYNNVVTADQGSVLGGLYNRIYNTEPSGSQGSYYCVGDVIAGGYGNYVYSKGTYQTQNFIGGGNFNYILYNGECNAYGDYYTATNVIGGGGSNAIYGYVKSASILGGNNNNISTRGAKAANGANRGFIGGGLGNKICMRTNGDYIAYGSCGVISGGGRNCITSLNCAISSNSTIGGGYYNCVQAIGGAVVGEIGCTLGSVVSGGKLNKIISECEIANYNAIGGGTENQINSAYGSTISGGNSNVICGSATCNSTIGGGYYNEIYGAYSPNTTISGGYCNKIYGDCAYGSTISGGFCQVLLSCIGTIGGGAYNLVSNKNAYVTIAGGCANKICGEYNRGVFIGGGVSNNVNGYEASYTTIAGGYQNTIIAPYVVGGDSGYAPYNTISGGRYNQITTTLNGFSKSGVIAGGECNSISGNLSYYSTISGGYNNSISGSYAPRNIIVGGENNSIDNGNTSVIGGGRNNQINGAYWSGIMSGQSNVINGGYHQTILGGVSNTNGSYCSHVIGSNITTDRVCTTFVNNLSIKSIPTAAAGLPAGSVWNNAGVLNIV
jgi:hypothetical protein